MRASDLSRLPSDESGHAENCESDDTMVGSVYKAFMKKICASRAKAAGLFLEAGSNFSSPDSCVSFGTHST